MVQITNNFLDNNYLEDLTKALSLESLNWNFMNYQFFSDEVKGGIICHTLVCKNFRDFFNFNFMEDVLKKKIKNVRVYLITKSHKQIELPVDKNNTDRFIFFINTNNGFFNVKDTGQIPFEENRLIYLPKGSHFFHSSCTDKDYKAYLEIDIQE
tara:strand:- start:79 stop:540 length:462 start_codon:yes stop_codon:yes gene_type:complete